MASWLNFNTIANPSFWQITKFIRKMTPVILDMIHMHQKSSEIKSVIGTIHCETSNISCETFNFPV